MNVIGDITRAHPGSLAGLVNRVLYAPSVIKLVLLEEQRSELDAIGVDPARLKILVAPSTGAVAETVLQAIVESSASPGITTVLSFNPAVFELLGRLDSSLRGNVVIAPWSMANTYVRDMVARQAFQQALPRVTGEVVPEQEVFAALRAALQKAGAVSKDAAVHKTSIRDMLAVEDARLSKENPAANGSGYITRILGRAHNAGVIGLEELSGRKNALIWLTGASEGTSSPPAPASKPSVSPSASGLSDMKAAKCVYPVILKKNNMGPFQNLRDDLYTCLENAALQRMPVEQLLTACVDATIAKHSTEKERDIPWTTVRNFLVTLLCRQPVLVSEDEELIAPSFLTNRTVIVRIDPGFREKLDGELVLCLLRQGAEILYMDVPALTGTLFPTREGKWETRANKIIRHLIDTNQVQVDGPQLVLPRADPATVVPIRPESVPVSVS